MRAFLLLTAALVGLSGTARAQQSNEDRLREALKRTTVELRAVQDGQASLQAQLADALKQRDDMKLLLDQATAKSAAPATPAVDPAMAEEVKRARQDLTAARAELASTQVALVKWQAAYKDAAVVAQRIDADAKRLDVTLKATHGDLDVCKQMNAKLIATARDLIHWYQSGDFRKLVLMSYEPFLGLKRVELDNTVQAYEDRIADAKVPTKPAR